MRNKITVLILTILLTASSGLFSVDDALYITSTGNVGIGTTSPSSALDIVGDLEVGGTDLFVDDSAGKVGIGTNSPSSTLEVNGDIETNNIKGNASSGRLDFGWGGADGGNLECYSKTSSGNEGNFKFIYGGGSYGSVEFTHYDGSNWSTKMKLDKDGKLNLYNTDAIYINDDSVLSHASNSTTWLKADGGNIEFQTTGGSTDVIIESGGDVGIGTLNPAYQLEVAGAVMMESISTPSAIAGHAGVYCSGSELYAIDGSGNTTQLSTHDKETGDWIFYSKNIKTGRVVRVNMEKFFKRMEEIHGENFMEEWIEK